VPTAEHLRVKKTHGLGGKNRGARQLNVLGEPLVVRPAELIEFAVNRGQGGERLEKFWGSGNSLDPTKKKNNEGYFRKKRLFH